MVALSFANWSMPPFVAGGVDAAACKARLRPSVGLAALARVRPLPQTPTPAHQK